MFIYKHSEPENVRYSVSRPMSYFTNIAVQNINKAFVYITEFTASLTCSAQASCLESIGPFTLAIFAAISNAIFVF